MTDAAAHLTEEERQSLADGTLDAERAAAAAAHCARCDPCARDVERLRRLVQRMNDDPPRDAEVDALWPAIRARIERGKVVPLPLPLGAAGAGATRDAADPAAAPQPMPRAARRVFTIRHGLVAAAVVVAAALSAVLLHPSRRIPPESVASGPGDTTAARAVAESVRTYQEEERALLARLEVQRATMRPDARAAADRDLATIDRAIDELQLAIESDPRNPNLRQLLAATHRQKVDLLRRLGNA